MKLIAATLVFSFILNNASAQVLDSIYFNLYTDSLKKGAWNYINVEGKLSNGKIIPLSSNQLQLKTSSGKVEGMSIWVDWNTAVDSILVQVQSKSKPSLKQEGVIWIKKRDLQMDIPSEDSLLKQLNERNRRKPKSKKG